MCYRNNRALCNVLLNFVALHFVLSTEMSIWQGAIGIKIISKRATGDMCGEEHDRPQFPLPVKKHRWSNYSMHSPSAVARAVCSGVGSSTLWILFIRYLSKRYLINSVLFKISSKWACVCPNTKFRSLHNFRYIRRPGIRVSNTNGARSTGVQAV